MSERKTIEGTVLSISNKVNPKGVSYSIYKVSTLEGKELDLFLWNNNLRLLNRLCRFEIESNIKDDKQYNTIITMEAKE
ncbi:MAG: hypothetical protein WCY27_03025 [archaeon]|uniref:hypothetical protein n=1 Tax=Methanoculleus sp. TaxID=90427 RepID=UPI0025D16135|nr:hypothetical protein [Methanoculleus sp.]MCK9319161.1 hypothetical protein [Methanoculleus sp.]